MDCTTKNHRILLYHLIFLEYTFWFKNLEIPEFVGSIWIICHISRNFCFCICFVYELELTKKSDIILQEKVIFKDLEDLSYKIYHSIYFISIILYNLTLSSSQRKLICFIIKFCWNLKCEVGEFVNWSSVGSQLVNLWMKIFRLKCVEEIT